MDIIGIVSVVLAAAAVIIALLQLRQDRLKIDRTPRRAEQIVKAPPTPLSKADLQLSDSLGRALIIEEVQSQQNSIKQVLEDLGYVCSVAGDFDSALDLVLSERFSLVTLDMQLDELDQAGQAGYLLLDQLHTNQAGVPVIIISGLPWPGSQVRDFLRKYDAFDYLSKPFDPQELRNRVQSIIDVEV